MNDPHSGSGADGGGAEPAGVRRQAAGRDDGGVERILVVYATMTGTTRAMAEAVAAGVRSVDGADATLVELEKGDEVAPDLMKAHHGLIIGSPMRHRNMDARVKLFVEHVLEVLWLTDDMVGMTGGVFTVGGGVGDAGAGCDVAQVAMLATMAANGMVLVPHPKTTPGFDHAGSHWGPAGRSGGPKMQPILLTDAMLSAGFHHGANVARVTKALAPHAGHLFARGNQAPEPGLLAQFMGGSMPAREHAEAGFPSGAGFRTYPSAEVRA